MNAQRWGIPFKFVTYVNSRSLFLFAVGKKLIACVCCFYIHYNFVAYSFTLPSIFTHLPHSPFFLFSSFLHFPILPSFSSFPYSVTLPFSFFFSTFSYSSSLSSLLVFLFPVYLLYVCGLTFHIPFIFLLSLLSLYFLLLFVPFSTFIHQPLLLTLFFSFHKWTVPLLFSAMYYSSLRTGSVSPLSLYIIQYNLYAIFSHTTVGLYVLLLYFPIIT